MTDDLHRLVGQVATQLRARRLLLVTAESCTGGSIAQACTALAGSSEWFERGFVTYSNDAKQEMLGVSARTLTRHGAVSEATAGEMAAGALRHSRGDVAVAVTGIAGPSGGSAAKPVGTVCFGWASRDGRTTTATELFPGDREAVRDRSVVRALEGVLQVLDKGETI